MVSQQLAPAPATAATEPPAMAVRVAGLWQRLLAALVDTACLAPVLLLLAWLAFRVTGVRLPSAGAMSFESVLELLLEGGSALYGLLSMAVVVLVLYAVLFLTTTAATPGMRLLRLRIINLYGETPEWWRVLVRCAGCFLACGLLGLGLLWIGFDREKRGLHDWIAGTYVIRTESGMGAPRA